MTTRGLELSLAGYGRDLAARRDYDLAVDLGTTFVAAALSRGGHPEMLTLGARSVVIPSAVYCGNDGTLLCGEAAVRQASLHPARAAREFKRRLGDPTPLRLGERTWSAVELLAALLGDVLRVATDTEGIPPRQVTLTHPACWGGLRRTAFAQVAELAGLATVATVTEPEAVAVHYVATRVLTEGQVVAVYDLGGGTFDTTVLRAHHDGVEILGVPEGIERLGGADFDDALFAHLDHMCDGALSELDVHDPRAAVALARVRQDVVLAKEHLSVDPVTVIPIFLPERNFDLEITRTAFEDLVRAHVESTVGALQRALRSARLSITDLDTVVLAGGSSRIPLIAEMITEALGTPVAVDIQPKYPVALGAARLAARTHPLPATDATAPAHIDRTPNAGFVDLIAAPQTASDTVAATFERGPTEAEDAPLATRHPRYLVKPTRPIMLVGALITISLTMVGYLVHDTSSPTVSAAAPILPCTTDCEAELSQRHDTTGTQTSSLCLPFSGLQAGCESRRGLPPGAEGSLSEATPRTPPPSPSTTRGPRLSINGPDTNQKPTSKKGTHKKTQNNASGNNDTSKKGKTTKKNSDKQQQSNAGKPKSTDAALD